MCKRGRGKASGRGVGAGCGEVGVLQHAAWSTVYFMVYAGNRLMLNAPITCELVFLPCTTTYCSVLPLPFVCVPNNRWCAAMPSMAVVRSCWRAA